MRTFSILLLATVLAGCSGTDELGTIGDTTFHSVHGDHFWGPNFTAMVVERDGRAGIVKVGFGPGAGHALVGAFGQIAAEVGAATMFGYNLEPDRYESNDTTTVTGGGDSSSDATATNGGAVTPPGLPQPPGGQPPTEPPSKPKPPKCKPKGKCKPKPPCKPKKPPKGEKPKKPKKPKKPHKNTKGKGHHKGKHGDKD